MKNTNIYLEDEESLDFFKALTLGQPVKKSFNLMYGLSLKAATCLRASALPQGRRVVCINTIAWSGNIVMLPGDCLPAELIFRHLYDLPADNQFWKNSIQFTRDVLTNESRRVVANPSLNSYIRFYYCYEFQNLLRTRDRNPWKHWVKTHPEDTAKFLKNLEAAIK